LFRHGWNFRLGLLRLIKSDGGKRRLAYPIAKHKEGIYVQLSHKGDGQQVATLEKAMRLSEDVIRYLTVKQNGPLPTPKSTSKDGESDKSEKEKEKHKHKHKKDKIKDSDKSIDKKDRHTKSIKIKENKKERSNSEKKHKKERSNSEKKHKKESSSSSSSSSSSERTKEKK
jgi:ribosomal protein S6